jgi:hypothetical protein
VAASESWECEDLKGREKGDSKAVSTDAQEERQGGQEAEPSSERGAGEKA